MNILLLLSHLIILGLQVFAIVLLKRIDARVRAAYVAALPPVPMPPKVDVPEIKEEPCDGRDRKERMICDIRDILEKDRKYLDPDFSERDMVELLGSNVAYVSEVINTEFGMNFKSLLSVFRIEYAVRLAERNPHLKVSDLAVQCGYHTEVTFCEHFKKRMGEPPGTYLKGLAATQALGSHLPSNAATPRQD